MDKVFIVIECDSNDESRILSVFCDEAKAFAYRNKLKAKGNYEHVFVEEWEVWR